MAKSERHRHNEQCLQAYQKEQGKEGDALPFGDTPPYATYSRPRRRLSLPAKV
jgi:hypothetical protein